MSRISDSQMYAHLWGTDELRAHFSERGRLEAWLTILIALAEAQASHGVIPHDAAKQIRARAKIEHLDLDFIAQETRRTAHSTLGLLRGLERVLPPDVAQYVYFGSTVQDITDTWTALTMKRVGEVAWVELRALESDLLELAETHRSLVMAGRTHGQIGSVITFGFKVASWADEIRRHIRRLADGRPRWLVGQLAGSVGTLGALDQQGQAVRADFCGLLGLEDPGMSWTTSRDRIVEFVLLLAMIATTLARIGDEVYELQRPEIGELTESASGRAVGSITMPHKRNPEGAEHLVTLARVVRSNAQLLFDASVQSHERDGRGWKAEWVAFPEVCLLTATSLRLARDLITGLEVNSSAMVQNLDLTGGYWASESALVELTGKLDKHRGQEMLHEALRRGRNDGLDFKHALLADEELSRHLDAELIDKLLQQPVPGSAAAMVDAVVTRAVVERSRESDEWC